MKNNCALAANLLNTGMVIGFSGSGIEYAS
jgi:hypothetical protein